MTFDMDKAQEFSSDKRLKTQMRVYHGPSKDKLLTGFSVDISAGGLFLHTECPLAVDESLMLLFHLQQQEKSISCNARVAWVNEEENPRKPELPPGVGVQFVDMSLDGIKAIRRFLEHNEIEPAW